MRKIILLTLLYTAHQVAHAQKIYSKIDSINSDKEVEKLIQSFDDDYKKFTLKKISEFNDEFSGMDFCKRIADSLGITEAFYKADFDNNGLTDLLAIGDYYDFKIFIVMNYGYDSLKLNRLTRSSFQECTFPKVINDTIIRYYYMYEPNWRNSKDTSSFQYKDLIFKFGDFVEYNPHSKVYDIEKIEYQTTHCFGTCPAFYLKINNDRSAFLNAESNNINSNTGQEIKGEFKTKLTEGSYLQIIDLVNYIDFPKLENDYSVSWTDDQTSTLTITYNNGQVKTIRDYGLIGTYGLDRVYQLLFDLRNNQNWK